MERIDQWLSSLYRADVLKEGNPEKTRRLFREEMAANAELRAAAEKRLAQAKRTIGARPTNHIEKWIVGELEKELKNVPAAA